MNYCHKWLSLSLTLILYSYTTGLTFPVSDYGAYPNDNLDDTPGIRSAVNAAISAGLNNTVIFGFGTYNLSSGISIYAAKNLTITGQGIDQTFLIGNAPLSVFSIQSCKGLTISSLSVDFDPHPFTAGYVIHVNSTYLDLQVISPHQTEINQQVSAILRYDPVAMRPAFGSNAYEIYQTTPPNVTTSLVSPGILRIPLQYWTQFRSGDAIVVRYGSQHHVISGGDVEDLTIKSIRIYTSWCMGLAVTRARRVTVMDYHVVPRNGRWMSSTVDCMNFLDNREYVHISDSKCSSMGDDGLSVHGMYFIVKQIINLNSLLIQTFAWPDTLNVGIGTHLEFSRNQQPFTSYARGTVLSITGHDSTSRIFTFSGPVNAHVDDYAVVGDAPQVIVKNLTIENNRARGILLTTRNVIIKQSILNQTSGPAILFQPSLYWHQGPAANNVTLTENLYINNNEGIAREKGMIAISPDPVQLVPVVTNVQISSSTFIRGANSQAIVQAFNGANISFYGNYIVTNTSIPLINICNSRNVTASNNTLGNNQTKIDQYYTFDTTNKCSTNLSTLIDVPPSAFNSQFSPPILPTSIYKHKI